MHGRTVVDERRCLDVLAPHAPVLEGAFPLEEVPAHDDRRKRWRIAQGTLDRLAGCTADELADLEMAVELLRRENRKEEADRLAGLGGN